MFRPGIGLFDTAAVTRPGDRRVSRCCHRTLDVVAIPIAVSTRNAHATIDMLPIGTNDVLGHITPAVLATGFVRMLRILQAAGGVHRFASQVDASGFLNRTHIIEVLLKRHSSMLPWFQIRDRNRQAWRLGGGRNNVLRFG